MDENFVAQPAPPLPTDLLPQPPAPKKKLWLGIGAGVIIFGLIGSFTVLQLKKSSPQSPQDKQSVTVTKPSAEPMTRAVQFTSYTDTTKGLAFAFQPAKVYPLKTNFTKQDAAKVAAYFGLSDYKSTNLDQPVFYNTTDTQKIGWLSFNLPTGAFSFQSLGAVKPSGNTSTTQATAKSLLQEIGLLDSTITCPVTYKKQGLDNVTFVECHRDWAALSAPLLTIPGIVNVPETSKLGSLQLATTTKASLDDPEITSVSNGLPGKIRPNDFNTVTIGVTTDQRIYSVESNLRWLDTAAIQALQPTDLISQAQALDLFKNQKAQVSLTLPAGNGVVDWQKVYPTTLTTAQKATISDIALAYLEQGPSTPQTSYAPFYVIRGTAQLASGYTVRFVQAVPAEKTKVAALANQGAVAGIKVLAAKNDKVEIGTFSLPPDPTNMPIATQGPGTSPAPSAVPSDPRSCDLGEQGDRANSTAKQATFEVPNYGTLTFVTISHIIYWKNTTNPNTDLETIRGALAKTIEEQYVINIARNFKQRTDLSVPQTNVQAKELFYRINHGTLATNTPVDLNKTPCQALPIGSLRLSEAPIPGSCIPRGFTHAQTIYDATAERVVKEANQGSLNQYADKPNLFSDFSLQTFGAILYGFDSQPSPGMSSCWITGESPALFIYPEKSMSVTVSTTQATTYTDPATPGTWNISADPNGTIHSGAGERSYLYYEYNPKNISWSTPQQGWIVTKDNWRAQVIEKIAQPLTLNRGETDILLSEIAKAMPRTQDDNIKISLAESQEVDRNLPLTISPKPQSITRLHFLVSATREPRPEDDQPLADANPLTQEPALPPLNRTGFSALEFGAHAVK